MAYLEPLRRVVDRPIGYVLDAETIIGEWSGTRWADVPRKAALYVNAKRDLGGRIDSGEIRSRYWIRFLTDERKLSGFDWVSPSGNTHRIHFLRDELDDYSTDERIEGLLAYVGMVRQANANVGSIAGMMGSIARASLTRRIRLPHDASVPADSLWRGGRIEPRKGVRAGFGATVLWDMANAYPTRLANLHVPSGWAEYDASAHEKIPEEPGFARALVVIPQMMLGPVPHPVRGTKASYPTDDELTGYWTFDELRAARESGCSVYLYDLFLGRHYSQPWRDWGKLILSMRDSTTGAALRLIKMGANQYVGSLAASGEIEYGRMVNRIEQTSRPGSRQYPKSLSVHGLVLGKARADLFTNALHPYGYAFVTCHTDGGIFLDEPEVNPEGFRVKRLMDECRIIDAQHYAYRVDGAPDWHYVTSGIPDRVAGPGFESRWERLKKGVAPADT